MNSKNIAGLCLTFGITLAALTALNTFPSAHADTNAADPELLQSLAQNLYQCAEQPYGTNQRTGNVTFGALRSHCAEIVISHEYLEQQLGEHTYAFVTRDSEDSDGGDLSDLYLQYDAREDQEVLVASHLLSFGDPALAVLQVTGHNADDLPKVLDPALNR